MPRHTLASPIATVYAQALLEVAGPERREAMAEALEAFVAGLEQVPAGKLLLETPAVDAATKRHILEGLRGTLDDSLLDFLGVLVAKQRAGELEAVAATYRQLADQAAGRARAVVRSAAPLAPEFLEQVRAGLQRRLGRAVELATEVDPTLIAGFVVRAEDTVWDASVHGSLERMRKEMVRSSGYED